MNDTNLPCLFCGDTSRERTSEHVVQRGFGSNWTLPNDVCCKCNTEIFSSMDKTLIEFARTLVYWNHPDIVQKNMLLQSGHSVYFDALLKLWISIRLDAKGKPILLPQIIIADKNRLNFIVDANTNSDYASIVKRIGKELDAPERLSLQKLIVSYDNSGNESLPEVQPALIRSSPNTYLIRAINQAQANQVENDILNRKFIWKSEPQEDNVNRESIYVPEIELSINFDLAAVDRALSKSAVNIVCSCLGSQIARNNALNNIKSFVLKNSPYIEGEFVQHLWSPDCNSFSSAFQSFVKPGCHTTILTSMPDGLAKVIFIFYGKPFAVVNLTQEFTFMNDGTYVTLIDYVAKKNQKFKLPDDFCALYTTLSQ